VDLLNLCVLMLNSKRRLLNNCGLIAFKRCQTIHLLYLLFAQNLWMLISQRQWAILLLITLCQHLILLMLYFIIVMLIEVANFCVVVLMILVLRDRYLLLGRHRTLFLVLFTVTLQLNWHIYLLMKSSVFSLLGLKIKCLHLECLLTTLRIDSRHIVQKMGRFLLLVITIRTGLSLLSALNRLQSDLCQILTQRPRSFVIMLGNRPIWIINQLHVVVIWVVADWRIGSNLLLGELWLRWFSVVSLLHLALFYGLLDLDSCALISLIILANNLALIVEVTLVMVPSLNLNWLLTTTLVIDLDIFNARVIQSFCRVFTHILLVLNLDVFI